MNKNNNKIKISNLEVSFGKKKVISSVNLNIKESESLVILGCSGSGKSVLIKSIIGLIPISKGTVRISDEKIGSDVQYNATKHNIGITFQNDALFDGMTVIDNLCFGLIHKHKLSVKESKIIALKALETMGFKKYIALLMPSELSGGMRKRIAIIRTIILNPEIIFFDEPTTGLDPINSDKIINIIHEYILNETVTSITITHSFSCADSIADSIAFIHEGKIIWHGEKNDFKHTNNKHIDNFLRYHKRYE